MELSEGYENWIAGPWNTRAEDKLGLVTDRTKESKEWEQISSVDYKIIIEIT